MQVHHVFPYEPRHLGISLQQWWSGQQERWPLAGVARTKSTSQTYVHVISWERTRLTAGESGLVPVVHQTLYNNARRHRWGDDWSLSLGRALKVLGPQDVVVVHLEGYASARLSLRAARRARCVLVLHGRGVGSAVDHDAADVTVVINDRSGAQVEALGVDRARIWSMTPSVDRTLFCNGGVKVGRSRTLGYVGRVEESKGAFDLEAAMRSLFDLDLRLECIGSLGRDDGVRAQTAFHGLNVDLLGERPPGFVAQRMKSWAALVLPSYTEGTPLAALEALACGLPVVAVEGVLPEPLAGRPGVFLTSRAEIGDGIRRAVSSASRIDGSWIPDHQAAGRAWDELYASLAPWCVRDIPSARPLVGRLLRMSWRR